MIGRLLRRVVDLLPIFDRDDVEGGPGRSARLHAGPDCLELPARLGELR